MNRFFKFALAALPLALLASCSDDDLAPGGNGIAEKTETRYLQVTISTPTATPGSRAWTEDNTAPDPNDPDKPTTSVVGNNGYYADGTEEENKIRTLEFYFYDKNKQFHSYVPMTVPNAPATPTENPREDNLEGNPGSGRPNLSSYYHCNVPVELVQGKTLPYYVICIVNSVEGTVYQGSSMADAQKKILDKIYGATKDKDKEGNVIAEYFGMSNSVYYGQDPVTGESGVLIMAAPFTTDKLLTETDLKTLEAQAGNAELDAAKRNEIEKYTINIPVERYAVKVRLDLGDLANTTTNPIPNYEVLALSNTQATTEGETPKNTTTIKLKFTPLRWGVNCTEQSFYFLKSFRQPDAKDSNKPSDIFATQDQMNTILFTGWNNATYKRCFWARTPGYYADDYPITSDEVLEIGGYNLKYKKWDECAEIGTIDENTLLSEYVMETTMKESRLTGDGLDSQYLPLSSLPSVMVLGQYQIVTGENTVMQPTDFYLYGQSGNKPYIYHGEKDINGTIHIKDKMLVDQTIVLLQNSDGKTYTPINKSTDISTDVKGLFVVEHPSKEVREYAAHTEAVTGSKLLVASDVEVLQIDNDASAGDIAAAKLYFFNPLAGEYQQIIGGEGSNLDYVNLLLYQNLGGAHHYKDGMAYFSAPIQHWGWYREGNQNVGFRTKDQINEDGTTTTITTDEPKTIVDWDWTKMETGDFGIVRNHIYTMKIGKIEGLGTAIADPTDPIVPPADKVKYAVHFHVNIQRWAVLPTQNWNW